jgi:hypothetical protein
MDISLCSMGLVVETLEEGNQKGNDIHTVFGNN